MQTWIFLSLVVLITAGGYGGYDKPAYKAKSAYGDDNDKPVYGDNKDKPTYGGYDKPVYKAKPAYGDDNDKPVYGDNQDKPVNKDKPAYGGYDKPAEKAKPVYGDDNDKPAYGDDHDDKCDFDHRDKYGVPKSLVPANSELVLLVQGEGYRAYSFDKSSNKWRETGRQVKLSDPKTDECVGSISSDATTEEPVDVPVKYQYSYFADVSYAIRTGVKVDQKNPCDKKCAPTAAYEIVQSSDYEGLLTGVTHVVVFDTKGGAPPQHPGKADQQVSISKEFANYAFYRGAAPEVKPLPKGHSYSYGDNHDSYGDYYDNYGDNHDSYGDYYDNYYH